MMPPQGEDPNQPYPGVGAALLLTIMAVFASVFTGIAFFGLGALTAYGVGRAVGVGAVATMAAQRVGEPQAERLGLRKLETDAIPVILCLVPAMLLMSEIDNYAFDYAGDEPKIFQQFETAAPSAPGAVPLAADAYEFDVEADAATEVLLGREVLEIPEIIYDQEGERIALPNVTTDAENGIKLLNTDDPASMIQAFIVMVGIIPIVDCFLIFGVIQQGLLRRMGFWRGICFAALFWMLLRPVPLMGATQFLVASIGTLGLGVLLGLVRVATRSVIAPMLLAAGWAAVQFVALGTLESAPMDGLNVPGTHLPLIITAASLAIVAWAAFAIYQEAATRFLTEPENEPGADGTGGGFGGFGGNEPREDNDVEDLGGSVYPFPPVKKPSHVRDEDDDDR